MKSKTLIYLLLSFLAIPISYAEECGITNLATCIPQKFFEYVLTLINTPFQPFLYLTKSLLSEPVNVEPFLSLWAIIVYLISIFYGLFMLFAGFNFIISGYSPEKRETAKEWLKNVVLMIFFVQASFFLYSLIIETSSSMTVGVLNIINPDFFELPIDNVADIAIGLCWSAFYLLSIIICIIILSLRYLMVAAGVVFFPLGIFFNFIPPLKGYGKLIINSLIILIFLNFFDSLILLGASMLVEIPLYQESRMLIMISAFFLISTTTILLLVFAIAKSAFGALNSPVGRAAKIIAGGK